MNEELITREGYEALKAEVEQLETQARFEIAEQIAKARAYGDLSENFEYQSAKQAQGQLEARIAQLKQRLNAARVVESDQLDNGTVTVGHRVRLQDLESNQQIEYHLVGQGEANAADGKISIQSPVGQGLFGRKVGDSITIEAPARTLKLKILEII